MQFEIGTIISLAALAISIGSLVFKSGQTMQRISQVETDSIARASALSASIQLAQSQLMETREDVARNYMTKPEISAIETRVTDKQKEILSRLDRLEDKQDKFHAELLNMIRNRAA